jgi:hypothetical protein
MTLTSKQIQDQWNIIESRNKLILFTVSGVLIKGLRIHMRKGKSPQLTVLRKLDIHMQIKERNWIFVSQPMQQLIQTDQRFKC